MRNINPYRMWKLIAERYDVSNFAPRVHLLSRLNRMKDSGELITNLIDAIGRTYNFLEKMQCLVEENVHVVILLSFVEDKDKSSYTNIVISLQIPTRILFGRRCLVSFCRNTGTIASSH